MGHQHCFEVILDAGSRRITISQTPGWPGQPPINHVTVQDEYGLRDGQFVSAEVTEETLPIDDIQFTGKTVKFFFIDGESPDAPHVAVLFNVERDMAYVGVWRSLGITVKDFAAATKVALEMTRANVTVSSFTTLAT